MIIWLITIVDDAKISANVVVLEDVPAGATAVGVPARIIFSEQKKNGGGGGPPSRHSGIHDGNIGKV